MFDPEADLPRAQVKRIVKTRLAELAAGVQGGDHTTKEHAIHKDALSAISESGKIFINFLTAAANDVCKESKRQTINAEDIFQALEDLEFGEFVGPLREALAEYRALKERNKEIIKLKKANQEQELPQRGDMPAGTAPDPQRSFVTLDDD